MTTNAATGAAMTTLIGTRHLIRLILRRDRLLLPLWVVPLGLLPMTYARSFQELFPTAAERQQYATTGGTNAGLVSLYGPLTGPSLGELVVWRGGFLPIIVALASLLTVIRHTRVEEETGRRELLGATVLGRHAGLAAALVTTFAANLLLGALVAVTLAGSLPVAGSIAAGTQLVVAGWTFAAIGGLAAQLTTGAGAARGIALGALGGVFLLRAVGDISGLSDGPFSWASWLSPIGWAHRIEPYAGDHWWVLGPAGAVTALVVAAAVVLSARRDLGAGLLPDRLGPATAAAGFRTPLALAWRLHRGSLAGWLVGFVLLGVVFGGLADSVGDMVGDNQDLADIFLRMGGRSALVDAYLVGIMQILGLLAAAYGIQAALRMRAEEVGMRAEPVLTAGVGRLRWAGSHLVFAALGPAGALLGAGAATGLVHGLNAGDIGGELPRVIGAAAVQLPAVWVLTAIAVALTGLLPRLVGASWAGLAVCLLLTLVGAAMRLDQWLLDVSPFTHLPKMPGGAVAVAPLVWLAMVAAGLATGGLTGLRRRDIPVT
ncbi:ABC transporter permease [Plantactinospora sp. GCM10030261]|uniref:ABC transporter permease n=1 Tax=Plantactinospora sp. GCM10030261 TaxID=3273420 RepID=UPI00361F96BB